MHGITCYCPTGLLPHFYIVADVYSEFPEMGVNALSGCYLISTPRLPRHNLQPVLVSMPSRAVTSFLQYPFKNLGFMRFPEPVFAGIYQNILTTTVFRAC